MRSPNTKGGFRAALERLEISAAFADDEETERAVKRVLAVLPSEPVSKGGTMEQIDANELLEREMGGDWHKALKVAELTVAAERVADEYEHDPEHRELFEQARAMQKACEAVKFDVPS